MFEQGVRPMVMSASEKESVKRELVASLSREREVRRIVVFGSFVTEAAPNDLDVAVYQDSDEPYLPLAMKYRRILRRVAERIPLDVVPLRIGRASGSFLAEIERGEVIYEG
jgi:predicted nucleotidyltransferase